MSFNHNVYIDKNVRKINLAVLKFCFMLFFMVSVLFLEYAILDHQNEKRKFRENIMQIEKEIDCIVKKRDMVTSYKKRINNLLGYEIYENYIKNSVTNE